MLSCALCGNRPVGEFELLPAEGATVDGADTEYWWHRMGCGRPTVVVRPHGDVGGLAVEPRPAGVSARSRQPVARPLPEAGDVPEGAGAVAVGQRAAITGGARPDGARPGAVGPGGVVGEPPPDTAVLGVTVEREAVRAAAGREVSGDATAASDRTVVAGAATAEPLPAATMPATTESLPAATTPAAVSPRTDVAESELPELIVASADLLERETDQEPEPSSAQLTDEQSEPGEPAGEKPPSGAVRGQESAVADRSESLWAPSRLRRRKASRLSRAAAADEAGIGPDAPGSAEKAALDGHETTRGDTDDHVVVAAGADGPDRVDYRYVGDALQRRPSSGQSGSAATSARATDGRRRREPGDERSNRELDDDGLDRFRGRMRLPGVQPSPRRMGVPTPGHSGPAPAPREVQTGRRGSTSAAADRGSDSIERDFQRGVHHAIAGDTRDGEIARLGRSSGGEAGELRDVQLSEDRRGGAPRRQPEALDVRDDKVDETEAVPATVASPVRSSGIFNRAPQPPEGGDGDR